MARKLVYRKVARWKVCTTTAPNFGAQNIIKYMFPGFKLKKFAQKFVKS